MVNQGQGADRADRIRQALEGRIKEMREGYYGKQPHTPIEYINGFEDAADMVSDLLIKGDDHGGN